MRLSNCKFCYSAVYRDGICRRHYFNLHSQIYSEIKYKNDKYNFTISVLQQHWLNTRGGRTINDLFIHNGKLYVIMTCKREEQEEQFVKLPKNRKSVV